MSNAKIDNNRNAAAIVVDTNGNPANLLVDPVTGRLLIDVSIVSATTPVLNNAKIDDNRRPNGLASDGTNPRPLLIDNRNGFLWCDLTIE